jgi:uncharacterized protein
VNQRGAIAVFVKTIGVSAVKTRLAAAIGREKAAEFYRLSLIAIHATVRQACEMLPLDAYWSVAEAAALRDECWKSFATISQGDGDLGDRLDRVYETLLRTHPFAILIGADAPMLSAEVLTLAVTAMSDPSGPEFAISRSFDGGYSLFAGRSPIAAEIWQSVPYSTTRTADVFVSRLRQVGGVAELPRVDDIDTFEDFDRLVRDAEGRVLLPEQVAVVQYAQLLLERASEVS